MPTPRILNLAPLNTPSRFGFPPASGVLTGYAALQQLVVMHLMATPGSDRYTREGGGVGAIVRAHQQGAAFAQSQADLVAAAARTKQELIASQTMLDLDPTEQLEELVVNVIERTQDQRLAFNITITSAAGEVGTFRI